MHLLQERTSLEDRKICETCRMQKRCVPGADTKANDMTVLLGHQISCCHGSFFPTGAFCIPYFVRIAHLGFSPSRPQPPWLLPDLQGVRPVASGLGSLFTAGDGDDDDGVDPLVYVKPKDPLSARPQTSSSLSKVRVVRSRRGCFLLQFAVHLQICALLATPTCS
jgi:hypothetical protein